MQEVVSRRLPALNVALVGIRRLALSCSAVRTTTAVPLRRPYVSGGSKTLTVIVSPAKPLAHVMRVYR